MRIEWDPDKAHRNRAKHGVSFEDASGLLAGEDDVLEIFDAAHSTDEDRFLAIGSAPPGILVVVYAVVDDDSIRIVSARRATRREQERFEAFWRGRHG